MSDVERDIPRATKWVELIVANGTPEHKIRRRVQMVADYRFEGAVVEALDVFGTIAMSTVSMTGVRPEKTGVLTPREERIERIVDALKPVIEDVEDA
ncbi:MAG: hypothetical protein KBD51_00220 [Candidatus Levybacteria bacterium]|nr:hypothetical protein [Candidatus Levybacteria bacterium]